MNYRERLDARLKMYREEVARERRPELVLFFAEHDGDPVDHIFIYEEQIPAIDVFFDYEPPFLAVIKEMGDTKYVYMPKEA